MTRAGWVALSRLGRCGPRVGRAASEYRPVTSADALSDAVDLCDLPALIAESYPESGARPGQAGPVRCMWREDSRPSGSLHRNERGVWIFTDHTEGRSYNAHQFLTQIMGQSRAEAAASLKARAGLSEQGGLCLPAPPLPGLFLAFLWARRPPALLIGT